MGRRREALRRETGVGAYEKAVSNALELCGARATCFRLPAYSSTKARCHIRRRTSNSRPGRDYGLSGTACGAGSGHGSRRISSSISFLIAVITISVRS